MRPTHRVKVLFVLTSKEYINNYIWTDSLSGLEEYFDISILTTNSLKKYIPKKYPLCVEFLDDDVFHQNSNIFLFYTNILRWKHRHKSKSFSYREKRETSVWNLVYTLTSMFRDSKRDIKAITNQETRTEAVGWSKNHESWCLYQATDNLDQTINVIKELMRLACGRIIGQIRATSNKYITRVLSKRPFFRLVDNHIRKTFSIPTALVEFIEMNNFKLIIAPSSAFEEFAVYLALGKTQLSYKYLMLIDNWDNLSSKSVLWELPDYVATWGRQSSEHAIQIQGFKPRVVFEIGTARLTQHLKKRQVNVRSELEFKYVLFVGTFLRFNEYRCLEIINNEINSNPNLYGQLKIVYRPHPYSGRLPEGIHLLNTVHLDQDFDIEQDKSSLGLLDFQRILALQKNSHFVLGGLTSLLIESSILGKNYLAFIHRERLSLTSPHRVYTSYTHFQGIESLPNLHFCDNLKNLPHLFRLMFQLENSQQSIIDRELAYFYDLNPDSFSKKLTDLIFKLDL